MLKTEIRCSIKCSNCFRTVEEIVSEGTFRNSEKVEKQLIETAINIGWTEGRSGVVMCHLCAKKQDAAKLQSHEITDLIQSLIPQIDQAWYIGSLATGLNDDAKEKLKEILNKEK